MVMPIFSLNVIKFDSQDCEFSNVGCSEGKNLLSLEVDPPDMKGGKYFLLSVIS